MRALGDRTPTHGGAVRLCSYMCKFGDPPAHTYLHRNDAYGIFHRDRPMLTYCSKHMLCVCFLIFAIPPRYKIVRKSCSDDFRDFGAPPRADAVGLEQVVACPFRPQCGCASGVNVQPVCVCGISVNMCVCVRSQMVVPFAEAELRTSEEYRTGAFDPRGLCAPAPPAWRVLLSLGTSQPYRA